MTPEVGRNIAYLFCFIVVSIAVTGYFIGLQSPMNPSLQTSGGLADFAPSDTQPPATEQAHSPQSDSDVMVATSYEDIRAESRRQTAAWRTSLKDLKTDIDPLAEFQVTESQKAFALALREKNRAFNGAPATIPHPIDQMSAAACMVCHGEGVKTESLRISKMPHQFLANCTQCHVEANPQHMKVVEFGENSFVGLPAPNGGERAFTGAPPTIPHSTWMRVDCMSCHGFSGQQGIRTTHPWRQNCQQCHAPSSELDQTDLDAEPQFLPPPVIDSRPGT